MMGADEMITDEGFCEKWTIYALRTAKRSSRTGKDKRSLRNCLSNVNLKSKVAVQT